MSEDTVDVGAVEVLEDPPAEVEKPKRKIKLNEDDMTLGMMEEFEDIVGKPLSTVMRKVPVIDPETKRAVPDPNDPKGRPLMEVQVSMKAMVALIFLGLREEDPTLTIDDVRKMKLSEFDLELESGSSVDPPETATD